MKTNKLLATLRACISSGGILLGVGASLAACQSQPPGHSILTKLFGPSSRENSLSDDPNGIGQTRSYDIPNATPYRYYRLTVSANNGNPSYLVVREIGLFGSDLTTEMTSPTTPPPNEVVSNSNFSADQREFCAFDKDRHVSPEPDYLNEWVTASGTTAAWIRYDFGAGNTRVVSRYTIQVTKLYDLLSTPKDWTLEGSNDAASWDTLDTRRNQSNWTVGETRSYSFSNATDYRYYRLNVSANNGYPSYLVIREIGFYGPDLTPAMTSPTTPPPNEVVSSSNWSLDQREFCAFDKDLQGPPDYLNEWVTASGTTAAWIRYDFGAGNTRVVNQYTIKGTKLYNLGSAPKDWTLEGSNDAASWVTLDTRRNESAWTLGETRNYSFSNVTDYRYYRLNVSANNGFPSYLVIREIGLHTAPDLTPAMTSPTTPPPYAVESNSNWSLDQREFCAFDKNQRASDDRFHEWVTMDHDPSAPPWWISYDFGPGNEQIVARYTIEATHYYGPESAPKDWTFAGSNDALVWTTLDTRTAQTNWMGCVPRTCAEQGFNCGRQGDGCGGFQECGSCTDPQTCGGGGRPGVCLAPPGNIRYFGYWRDTSISGNYMCEIQTHSNYTMIEDPRGADQDYAEAARYGISVFPTSNDVRSGALAAVILDDADSWGRWCGVPPDPHWYVCGPDIDCCWRHVVDEIIEPEASRIWQQYPNVHRFINVYGAFREVPHLYLPPSVDWIGLECNNERGVAWCRDLLNSLRPFLRPDDKIFILLPGGTGSGTEDWLVRTAQEIYDWARTEQRIIGLNVFVWATAQLHPPPGPEVAVRELPALRAKFRQIGTAITGRDLPIPADCHPQ